MDGNNWIMRSLDNILKLSMETSNSKSKANLLKKYAAQAPLEVVKI